MSTLQFKLLNPLLNAFFALNDPTKSPLKDIYVELRLAPQLYAVIVPNTASLLNDRDSASTLTLRELCFRPEFIREHLVDLRHHNVPVPRNASVAALLAGKKSVRLQNAAGRDLVLRKDVILAEEAGVQNRLSVAYAEFFINFNSFFPKDAQFLLIHVDRPVVGTPISELAQPIAEPPKPPRNPQKNPILFSVLCSRVPALYPCLQEDYAHLFSSFVLESIDDPREVVTLFKETTRQLAFLFKGLPPDILAPVAAAAPDTDLNRVVYDHVEHSLYPRIWSRLCSIMPGSIDQVYDRLRSLLVTQVDVFSDYHKKDRHAQTILLLVKIDAASRCLAKLEDAVGYQKKLDVLVATVAEVTRTITKGGCTSMDVGADVLVALMLLVVIRARVPYLHVHIEYVKSYAYGDATEGFVGYCISTLEAVLFHLQSTEHVGLLEEYSLGNEAVWALSRGSDTDFEILPSSAEDSCFRSITASGESCLMIAVRKGLRAVLEKLLTFFSSKEVLEDHDCEGVTLLMQAVLQERPEMVQTLISGPLKPSKHRVDDIIEYLQKKDSEHGRHLAHHFSQCEFLIETLGPYVDWRAKDLAGNTPLMAICRNYDVTNYGEVISRVLKTCKDWYKAQGLSFNHRDHIDLKRNTLLHVLADGHLGRILDDEEIRMDINAFNERGYLPLVVYMRYNRVKNVRRILMEERLNMDKLDRKTFLTALDYVKFSANSRPGTPAAEETGEMENMVDSFYINKNLPMINMRKFGVLRARIDGNQWHFVIKGSIIEGETVDQLQLGSGNKNSTTAEGNNGTTSDPSDPSNEGSIKENVKISELKLIKIHHYSNYHSLSEFKRLIHLLHIEYPVSYLPIAYLMDIVFSRLNISSFAFFNVNKMKVNELVLRLNVFLIGLELSRELTHHELLWEFLILPRTSDSLNSLEARSKLKVASLKERLVFSTPSTPSIVESPVTLSPNIPEEFTDSGVENLPELFATDKAKNYSKNEIEEIRAFLGYSASELEAFGKVFTKTVRLLVLSTHKVEDLNLGLECFSQILSQNPLFTECEGRREEHILGPLAKTLHSMIEEDACTVAGPHKKFIYFLQFLENCISRLLKNIASVVNKKIHKWLVLYKEVELLKNELRRLRPEDFEESTASTAAGSVVDSVAGTPPVSQGQTVEPESLLLEGEDAENPFSDMVDQRTLFTVSSKTTTIATIDEETPVQKPVKPEKALKLAKPPQRFPSRVQGSPPHRLNSPEESASSSPNEDGVRSASVPPLRSDNQTNSTNESDVMGSPLRSLRSPSVSTDSPTAPSFERSGSVTTQVLSMAALTPGSKTSLPLRAAFGGQPTIKKKRSFFSNILETRKINYEMKVIKQYKMCRLKLMTLSNDVKYNHEMLATEVSNFMEFKEVFLKYAMKVFVSEELRRLRCHKTSLEIGLEGLKKI